MKNEKVLENLKKEFSEIQRNPNASIGFTVGLFNNNDLYNWKLTFLGPKDSCYAGGVFFLKLSFPSDYPDNPPQINFLTPIYHLNICPIKSSNSMETLGYVHEIFIKFIKGEQTRVKELLTKLYAIFYNVDSNYAYGIERKKEFVDNKHLYESKAKYFTNLYASVINLDKNLKYNNKNSTNDNNYDKENEINLLFNSNGINEKEVKCKLGEITKDVIQKAKDEYKIKDDSALYIFDLRKIDLNKSIGGNGFKDNYNITIISDYKNNYD